MSEPLLGVVAIARPGDTVLIGFESLLDEQEVENLLEHFEPLKAKGIEIGILDGVRSMVVLRPESDDIDDWGDGDDDQPGDSV